MQVPNHLTWTIVFYLSIDSKATWSWSKRISSLSCQSDTLQSKQWHKAVCAVQVTAWFEDLYGLGNISWKIFDSWYICCIPKGGKAALQECFYKPQKYKTSMSEADLIVSIESKRPFNITGLIRNFPRPNLMGKCSHEMPWLQPNISLG